MEHLPPDALLAPHGHLSNLPDEGVLLARQHVQHHSGLRLFTVIMDDIYYYRFKTWIGMN